MCSALMVSVKIREEEPRCAHEFSCMCVCCEMYSPASPSCHFLLLRRCGDLGISRLSKVFNSTVVTDKMTQMMRQLVVWMCHRRKWMRRCSSFQMF